MIGKIQNSNIPFGYLYINPKDRDTKVALAVLLSDEDTKKALEDSFEKIHKTSGENMVTLWAREYPREESVVVNLSSVRWPTILPSLRIASGMDTESKIKAIEAWIKKSHERMGITKVADISDLLKRYSRNSKNPPEPES